MESSVTQIRVSRGKRSIFVSSIMRRITLFEPLFDKAFLFNFEPAIALFLFFNLCPLTRSYSGFLIWTKGLYTERERERYGSKSVPSGFENKNTLNYKH